MQPHTPYVSWVSWKHQRPYQVIDPCRYVSTLWCAQWWWWLMTHALNVLISHPQWWRTTERYLRGDSYASYALCLEVISWSIFHDFVHGMSHGVEFSTCGVNLVFETPDFIIHWASYFQIRDAQHMVWHMQSVTSEHAR